MRPSDRLSREERTAPLFGRSSCWAPALAAAALLASLAGCASSPLGRSGAAAPSTASGRDPAQQLAVDCLLPGQIRQLGTQITYVSRRTLVRTTTRDCEIRGGEYVAYDRANYATALSKWQDFAKEGDPKAQLYVGELYEKGLGTAQDYTEAARWYRLAAAQNYAPAEINLGLLYERGLGVPKDTTEALRWYRRASGLSGDEVELAAPATTKQRPSAEEQRLRHELAESQRELQRLRDQLERVRSEQQEAEGRSSAQAGTGEELEQVRRRYETQLKRLTSELDTLRSSMDEKNAKIAALERQATAGERPSAEEQRLRSELAESQRQLQRLRDQLERVRSEQQEAERRSGAQARTGEELEQVRRRDETQLKRLTSELDTLRSSIDEKNAKIAALEKQQSSDQGTAPPEVSSLSSISLGSYYALVVGDNNYQHMNHLKTAAADAQALSQLLKEKYGFQVSTLVDADRDTILRELYRIDQVMDEDGNLLVYYAGHGMLDKAVNKGYWIPVDGEPTNKVHWISNTDITDFMKAARARHVLVVADSCYSGTLVRTAQTRLHEGSSEKAKQAWLATRIKSKSRYAFSSGGEAPVLDQSGGEHSIFAQALLDVLRKNESILDAENLSIQVATMVTYAAGHTTSHSNRSTERFTSPTTRAANCSSFRQRYAQGLPQAHLWSE